MTCSQVPQLVDVLLSMKMGLEKLFGAMLTVIRNCIMNFFFLGGGRGGGGNEKVAASTFRLGLLEDSKLKDSLTIREHEPVDEAD